MYEKHTYSLFLCILLLTEAYLCTEHPQYRCCTYVFITYKLVVFRLLLLCTFLVTSMFFFLLLWTTRYTEKKTTCEDQKKRTLSYLIQ
jgi:hypothetical protein